MKIDSYSFGAMAVDGHGHASDLILYPDHVDDAWRRKQGHQCCLADLPDVWRHRPAVLVIGTGDPGLMQVDRDLKDHCAGNGVELIVQPTAQAVDTYNQRRAGGATVIAAFHLTC